MTGQYRLEVGGSTVGQSEYIYLGGHGSVFWVSSANFFFQNSGGAGLKMGSNQSLIYIFYEFCEKLPILMVKTV